MNRQTVFLFAGQGSHYYQMGRRLYEEDAVYRSELRRLDELAAETLRSSVLAAIYGPHGKSQPFSDIRLTHPAIFMVEYALARAAIARGARPDITLGASLGIFAALAIAGRLSADDALRLVIRQALTIHQYCPAGGMLAVLSDSETLMGELSQWGEISGRNFAGHFIVSTPSTGMAAIEHHLKRQGVVHQRLEIDYPFHSSWIEPVKPMVQAQSRSVALNAGPGRVICCALAGELKHWHPDHLWHVARGGIAFADTIGQLEAEGAHDYLDLSPSGTLGTFMRYLLPQGGKSRCHVAMTPYGNDLQQLSAAVGALAASPRRDAAIAL
ncbi:acyltransferase domain-containing protein [Chromobacterium alticapitis]|uniref:Protein BatH n=1 Tax=Chromobacterium alticapitis TaxID=2073169 RepID=A0A2S5DDZ4_9NEIS|nr:acyltransferase domain-containing protein [Chromobacterium alticapitis]POZ61208.1 protein BatH [Chromobacterium alticapitis]